MAMKNLALILARALCVVILIALAIVPLAIGLTTLPLVAVQTAAVLALFGLWSAGCVVLGAWLTHRRQAALAPVSFDPHRMFNWMRTGKAAKAPEDESPPIEENLSDAFEWEG
jgi:hypothetical protein